ncbi:zinc-finger [Saccharopolyspora kobensis]|uniref:Zinc-finger n=1 Tax=Saccharopolyspora kobensis TaxID=146035 RepID=A0A1H6ECC4_9PSEU|nr:zinc finger protein [Saccharopolyspora kobensis]SEG95460.1 zinc-finger [Saccharopolyspora kobensis]SFD56176.1 zinc-finger [Saccharopolyspora kobensis]
MSTYLKYVWRPVTGGRHAFPIAATKTPHGEEVEAYCGVTAPASELHDRSEVDWVRESSCMKCWRHLADKGP